MSGAAARTGNTNKVMKKNVGKRWVERLQETNYNANNRVKNRSTQILGKVSCQVGR